MPRGVRWVLAISLGAVVVVGIAVGATVGTVYRAGSVSLSYEERGTSSVQVAVPAAVANIALVAASWLPVHALPVEEMPDEALHAIDHYLPAAQDALDELAAQADFTLVEVTGRDEHILVRKEGRKLRIRVDSDDTSINVTVPLATVREFTRRLHRISRDW